MPKKYPDTTVRMAGYAWAYEVATEPILNPGMTDIRKFGGYWGSEIELMGYVKDHLGFEASIFSPEQEVVFLFCLCHFGMKHEYTTKVWGAIDLVNGSWTGLIELLKNDKADVMTVCSSSYKRYQVKKLKINLTLSARHLK